MSERRGDLRGAREERLFIKVLPSDENPESESLIISASTEDVSSSGLSLTISENLPQDTQLELWVEIKGCPGKFLLNGAVRWCRPNGEEFVCGIELSENEKLSDLADWQDLFV